MSEPQPDLRFQKTIDELKGEIRQLKSSRSELGIFRRLADAAGYGFGIADFDGNIIYINHALCYMVDEIDPETVLGKNVVEYYPNPVKPRLANEIFPHTIKTGQWVGDLPLLASSGREIPTIQNIFVVHTSEGQPYCLGKLVIDITEREKIEAALKKSEQKIRAIMDQSFQFVGLLKTDGTLIEANRTSLDFVGLKESDVIGKPFWETPWWAHSTGQQELLKKLIHKAARGEVARFEPSHMDKDGKRRFMDSSIKPVFDENGEVIYLLPEGRDITERKEVEEELRQSRLSLEERVRGRTAELEAANRQLKKEIYERERTQGQLHVYQKKHSSMASQLSLAEEKERRRIAGEVHDHIGQNLAFAKMKLDGLRKSTSLENRETVTEITKLLDGAIQDTRSLVSELGSPVLYELGLVPAVEWLTKRTQKHSGLEVSFKDDGRPKPVAEEVSFFLYQAIRELLANVVKHAKAKTCDVSLTAEEKTFRTVIVDDGIGFAAEEFWSNPEKEGGFGFFSIRERLKPIGGNLKVLSRPGGGTRIVLIAPLLAP